MSKFNMIKIFYSRKLWNIVRVADAVKAGWITAEEFKKIVGTDYKAIEAPQA